MKDDASIDFGLIFWKLNAAPKHLSGHKYLARLEIIAGFLVLEVSEKQAGPCEGTLVG